MEQEKWFNRKFDFGNNQNIFPSILERLKGTPIRMEEKLKGISENVTESSINNTWTIKENIGHLTNLETLWQERLEDIINNQVELREADLTNTKTFQANHNSKSLQKLLNDFREIRKITISKLQYLDDEIIFKSVIHPRLKTPMRTIDLFLFVAEHDDHHLARITKLINTTK